MSQTLIAVEVQHTSENHTSWFESLFFLKRYSLIVAMICATFNNVLLI